MPERLRPAGRLLTCENYNKIKSTRQTTHAEIHEVHVDNKRKQANALKACM